MSCFLRQLEEGFLKSRSSNMGKAPNLLTDFPSTSQNLILLTLLNNVVCLPTNPITSNIMKFVTCEVLHRVTERSKWKYSPNITVFLIIQIRFFARCPTFVCSSCHFLSLPKHFMEKCFKIDKDCSFSRFL